MINVTINYQSGQSESLACAELDIFERYQFVDLLVAGKTPEIVMLCTKRNADWLRSLKPACVLELAKKFIGENFPHAMAIAKSDPIAGLKVGNVLHGMAKFFRTTEELGAPSPFVGSAPSTTSSPGPESGAASGSASPTTPAPAAAAAATPAPAAG